ncbi:MAG: type II restriction enzyme, partial [Fimbriimonadales bacterium]
MAEQNMKRAPKHQVILKLFNECRRKGTLQFNNDDVKRVSGEKFKNQFDATKFDTRNSLPEE